jgi:hypothetical protein
LAREGTSDCLGASGLGVEDAPGALDCACGFLGADDEYDDDLPGYPIDPGGLSGSECLLDGLIDALDSSSSKLGPSSSAGGALVRSYMWGAVVGTLETGL